MDAERWQRVKTVFGAALSRAPETRETWLDEACDGDADLRREVEGLLASHLEAEHFLSRPATFPSPASVDDLESIREVGPYRLTGPIGQGGMGTVYRAVRVDDAYDKVVAVKLMRGGSRSEYLEHRFRQERQILARLAHPNIAAVFDGGTTADGQPYFVMEYVEGRSITEFCSAQSLRTRERLLLFATVCDAVQYAHRNLVVHRDLKPDNVLVTADGVPKLLDFGIAKLLAAGLDPEEAPTATLLPMMTPEYASPEQIKGEAVTTASDVYALGVVLYELLAGERPYAVRTDSLPDIVRAVCETDPPLPSAVAARRAAVDGEGLSRRRASAELRGDLDTIVMKALRKDPARRYSSAQDLASDIRRHLGGLPVRARPDTLGYRASKFVARHAAAVVAAALVFASLVTAVVLTTRQARIAEKRLEETRRLANALVFDVYDAVKGIPGSTSAKALIVKRGIEHLDGLAAESRQDPRQRLELSTAYVKLGDALGEVGFGNLGDTDGALASYGKALAIRERLAAESPSDMRVAQQVATVLNRIGAVRGARGDVDGALEHYRRALRISEEAARALGDPPSRRRLVVGHWELCTALVMTGDAPQALREAREGLAVAGRMLAEDATPDAQNVYAAPLECQGDALALEGDTAGAMAAFEGCLKVTRALMSAPPSPMIEAHQVQIDTVTVGAKLGGLLTSLGRTAEARRVLDEALQAAEKLARLDYRDVEAKSALAECRLASADLTARMNPKDALAEYQQALAGWREASSADPANLSLQSRVGTALLRRGEAELRAGLEAAAARSLDEAGTRAQDLHERAPAIRDHALLLARVRFRRAMMIGASFHPARCADLRQAEALWASLAERPLKPREAAERGAVLAAAHACAPSVAARSPTGASR